MSKDITCNLCGIKLIANYNLYTYGPKNSMVLSVTFLSVCLVYFQLKQTPESDLCVDVVDGGTKLNSLADGC